MNRSASHTDGDLSKDIANLQEDMVKIKDDLKSMSSHLIGHGRESVGRMADHAKDAAGQVQTFVQQRPVTVALAAAGVGLVLGTLLARR